MKYSYNWLKELTQTKKKPTELADLITKHAFEIEGLEKIGHGLENVVVGKILEIKKHPNADKLQLTKVDVGKEILAIVCGAHNIAVGDKVPVATVGTKLPNGIEIKAAEIRGEKSFGMLCAEDELGLGNDHSGIIILNKNVKAGTSVIGALELDDTMIEIDVLANRAHDAVSHVGMAREIAALENTKMSYDYDGLVLPKKKSNKISLEIKNKKICDRYIGAMIENVKVGDSPQWLKSRLRVCGLRPVNNVVDITNYIMLELGQPLHAFDFDKVKNQKNKAEIVVRLAREDEKLTLLDGTQKKLKNEDIVIANKQKVLALAGVMGGIESGVDGETVNVVLEAANFAPSLIRHTRMKQGLFTDAALRFEKELDTKLAEKAMTRAIELFEHLADGTLEGIVDEYLNKSKNWSVKLEIAKIEKLLGMKVPSKECKRILVSLGCGVIEKKEILLVEIPTFRLDLQDQEDLIEEIGRIYGYEKIQATAPLAPIVAPKINEERAFVRKVKNLLVEKGFSEVYNYSFYSQRDAGLVELGNVKHLELKDPGNAEQALMRVSLIPNILKNVQHNLKHFKEITIFEIGRVFWVDGQVLPNEKTILVGAVVLENQTEKNRKAQNFFEAKGYCDNLLSQLGIVDYYYDNFDPDGFEMPQTFWHQGRSAQIKLEGSEKAVGFVGEVNPLILANLDIHTRVALFEFEMDNLRLISSEENEFKPLRRFPLVFRDVALVSQGGVLVDQILQTMQLAAGEMLLDADLFDMFDFADGSTSFAFHLTFGLDERTLKSEEVEKVLEKIILSLEKELNVTLRK